MADEEEDAGAQGPMSAAGEAPPPEVDASAPPEVETPPPAADEAAAAPTDEAPAAPADEAPAPPADEAPTSLEPEHRAQTTGGEEAGQGPGTPLSAGGREYYESEDYGESETDSETDSEREAIERKNQLMREYYDLVQEIEAQNRVVKELKGKICEKCQGGCLTKCEEREVKNLRCCMEKENLKLQCLLRRAIALQEEDPSEVWDEIPIATTFEEDSMPIGLSYNVMKSVCKKTFSDDECCREMKRSKVREGNSNKAELERFLRCLLQKAKKTNACGRKRSSSSSHDDDDTLLALDDETLQRVMRACEGQTTYGKKGKCKKDISKVCKELTRSYSMQEKLVHDNADLEGDRFKLQEEVLGRDRMIECLQQKIQVMQCDLQKLCREKQKIMKESTRSGDMSPKKMERLKKYRDCTKQLQGNIDCMQSSVERMKLEMNSLRKERNQWECQVKNEDVCPRRKSKAAEIEELKKNYTNLLADYCKKENDLKELQHRARGFVDPCDRGGSNIDSAELEMLREKVKDLQEEQEEFKCLIKEQADHMEDYRNKYMIAQQKVEEQKCLIEKLEMNNKRIEDQINMEIQRIKSKFQDKLKELAQLPKLLENEQLKLATCCKEKEDLEQKLRLVCKELKAVKAQISPTGNSDGLAERLRQAENDLAHLQKKYDDMKADKALICEKLQRTQEDLDCLRTESARIIARTKERAENQREILQNRIDKLEKELAQCRATTCFSISDREEIIKEMKGQLSTLSYSFDSAQKQIKTLKNHISFLSNENAFPVK